MVNQELLPPSQPIEPGRVFPQPPPGPQPRKNKALITAVFIIGLLVVGGGAFGYFYYFQSPEKIVQRMIARSLEVKSLEYRGAIQAEITISPLPNLNKQEIIFSFNFNGVSDTSELNNPKSSLSFDVGGRDALKREEFAVGLEIRSRDKIIYIKLSNIPNFPFFDLSSVANQWIKIDTAALKKQFGVKETQEEQELSLEQIEKIKKAVRQAKILEITDKLPSEKIEGVNTHHFKFIINKDGIKKLFIDINTIVRDKALSEKELADFNKSLETLELLKGETWIGKKDLLPYKIILSSVIKETAESKTSGNFTITLAFKNFNKPAQVDIPAPVKTLEEILGGLLLKGQLPGK